MSSSPRLLFVNLPVADVARSRAFFTALGFTFNEQFSDETAICMIVNEGAFYMLLSHAKFGSFTKREVVTPAGGVAAYNAFSVASRDEVDATFARALEAGGSDGEHTEDHGFMYSRTFFDPDGHCWEGFWMDPAAVG